MNNPPITAYVTRVFLLMVTTAFFGAFCAAFANHGVMMFGLLCGFSLSLGLLIIHFFCRHRLTRGEPPKGKVVVLASIISGLVGGMGIQLLETHSAAAFLKVIGGQLVLHFVYHARWKFGMVGMFMAMVPALFIGYYLAKIPGLVFPIVWLFTIVAFDPAWSFERWKRCWPHRPVAGETCILSKKGRS